MSKKVKIVFPSVLVLLLLVYESQNIFCLSYRYGIFEGKIKETFSIEIEMAPSWCPSIKDIFKGEEQSQYAYVKNNFLNPWNFSNYLIFSRPNYNNNAIEERNLFKEEKFPWGIAYLINRDSKGVTSVYSKSNNIQITASDMRFFNELEKLAISVTERE